MKAKEGLRGRNVLQSGVNWYCYIIVCNQFAYIEERSNDPLRRYTVIYYSTKLTYSWAYNNSSTHHAAYISIEVYMYEITLSCIIQCVNQEHTCILLQTAPVFPCSVTIANDLTSCTIHYKKAGIRWTASIQKFRTRQREKKLARHHPLIYNKQNKWNGGTRQYPQDPFHCSSCLHTGTRSSSEERYQQQHCDWDMFSCQTRQNVDKVFKCNYNKVVLSWPLRRKFYCGDPVAGTTETEFYWDGVWGCLEMPLQQRPWPTEMRACCSSNTPAGRYSEVHVQTWIGDLGPDNAE